MEMKKAGRNAVAAKDTPEYSFKV